MIQLRYTESPVLQPSRVRRCVQKIKIYRITTAAAVVAAAARRRGEQELHCKSPTCQQIDMRESNAPSSAGFGRLIPCTVDTCCSVSSSSSPKIFVQHQRKHGYNGPTTAYVCVSPRKLAVAKDAAPVPPRATWCKKRCVKRSRCHEDTGPEAASFFLSLFSF